MSAAAHTKSEVVHVHGAEISTEPALLWDYAEALAVLVAIIALAAAMWIAAAPRQDADLTQPAPPAPVAIAPIGGTFERAEGETRDVVQPDPDGPASTEVAVVTPSPAS